MDDDATSFSVYDNVPK